MFKNDNNDKEGNEKEECFFLFPQYALLIFHTEGLV